MDAKRLGKGAITEIKEVRKDRYLYRCMCDNGKSYWLSPIQVERALRQIKATGILMYVKTGKTGLPYLRTATSED